MKFNQSKYSNSYSSKDSNDSLENSYVEENLDGKNEKNGKNGRNEEFVEKGHKNTLSIDLNYFEELCKKFREKKDTKIKNLSGEDKANFDLIVSYVHMLYGTNYYNHIYDRVRKYFKDVKSIKPGTIGGYFAGCLNGIKKKSFNISNDFKTGCSVTCAGSMPLPKEEEGWNFCDKSVILAEKGIKGFSFSFVKAAESKEDLDPAYVFVESGSLNTFSGFSKEEKDHLRALGCEKVKLIGYSTSDDNVSYSELYKEPKKVNEIKHRFEEHRVNHNEDTATWIWLIIILIIIFILLLCFLGYKYYRS